MRDRKTGCPDPPPAGGPLDDRGNERCPPHHPQNAPEVPTAGRGLRCSRRPPPITADDGAPAAPDANNPLLARLDALTDLAHRRHGLLLAPDGQLTNADAAAVAHAIGIEPGRGGGVELLLLLGIAVGILRADRPRERHD